MCISQKNKALMLIVLAVFILGNFCIRPPVAETADPSHNANLAGLTVSSGSLSPAFTVDTSGYSVAVDSAISFISVAPTAADPTASITVNGAVVSSGSSSPAIHLVTESTYIGIVVTAQDGTTQKVYSVTVTRPPASLYLSSLGIIGASLDQEFSKTTTYYTATVNVSGISVIAVPEDLNARVIVEGRTLAYGMPSEYIYLDAGLNRIDVQVVSNSGSSMIYYIDVTQRGSSETLVETKSATNVGANSAMLNGSISSSYNTYYNGYYNRYNDYYYNNYYISEYGFFYSTDQNSWTSVTVGNGSHTGSFNYTLKGLKPNTNYYFKAFVYVNNGYVYGSTLSFQTTRSTTIKAPSISPNGGNYTSGQTVSIGSIDSGCTAYYTTDGSNPTTSSTRKLYNAPFSVQSAKVVKAAVWDSRNELWSPVTTASFSINSYTQIPVNTPAPASSNLFWDVPPDYWAYNTINSLKSRGCIKGYPDSSFNPDDSISRAEIAAIVTSIIRAYFYDANARHFDDVAPEDWFFAPVEKTYQLELISVQGSFFGPNRAITREELAEVLVNALGKHSEAQANMYEATDFNDDSRISSRARGYVVIAVKYGLVTGYPESNNFEPQSGATRAEACVMISSFLRQYL